MRNWPDKEKPWLACCTSTKARHHTSLVQAACKAAILHIYSELLVCTNMQIYADLCKFYQLAKTHLINRLKLFLTDAAFSLGACGELERTTQLSHLK